MSRGLKIVAVVALLFTAGVCHATVVPDSTVLPARLETDISSRKAKPGQVITARVMQDVPLPGDAKIPAGSMLAGEITAVQPASESCGGTISFRFDTLRISKETVRLTLHLRAIASMWEVSHAQMPRSFDPTLSENSWTTIQIGGDIVNRTSGSVRNRSGIVGKPVVNGVLVRLDPNPGRGCRGDGTGERPQALWLFSTDACGTYDLQDLTIARPDHNSPASATEEITLHSTKGDVDVRTGGGLLLLVYAP